MDPGLKRPLTLAIGSIIASVPFDAPLPASFDAGGWGPCFLNPPYSCPFAAPTLTRFLAHLIAAFGSRSLWFL